MNARIVILSLSLCSMIACGENAGKTGNEKQTAGTAIKDTETLATTPDIVVRSPREFGLGQLMQYIPGNKLYGFEAREPINGEEGGIGKTGSRYFPFVSQKYYNKEQSITIEVIDYVMDPVQYNGLIRMYGFDTTIDNNVMKTKKLDLNIQDTRAIAAEYRLDTASKIIIGAADRFLVIITGAQFRDIDLLRKVAGEMDLKKLIAEAKKSA